MSELDNIFKDNNQLFIHQKKEWVEIFTGLETKNQYEILGSDGKVAGHLAEIGSGLLHLLARLILKAHRSLELIVWNAEQKQILKIKRPFYWFFSDMTVSDHNDKVYGHVYRRFSLLFKKYDLMNAQGEIFATIKTPIWSLWTFKVLDKSLKEICTISKKWGGVLKEVFTDSDKFQVDFQSTPEELRPIIFAAAITIDLDYFEDNNRQ